MSAEQEPPVVTAPTVSTLHRWRLSESIRFRKQPSFAAQLSPSPTPVVWLQNEPHVSSPVATFEVQMRSGRHWSVPAGQLNQLLPL